MCAWGGGEGQASGFTFLNSVLPLEIQPSRTPGAKRSRSDLLEQVRCPSKVCRPGEQTLQFPRKIGRRVASRYGTCNNRSVFGPPLKRNYNRNKKNELTEIRPASHPSRRRTVQQRRARSAGPADLAAAAAHANPPASALRSRTGTSPLQLHALSPAGGLGAQGACRRCTPAPVSRAPPLPPTNRCRSWPAPRARRWEARGGAGLCHNPNGTTACRASSLRPAALLSSYVV